MRRIQKKAIRFLSTILLLIGCITNVHGTETNYYPLGDDSIPTNVSIKINGEAILNGANISISQDEAIQISLNWEIPNDLELTTEDILTYPLPEKIIWDEEESGTILFNGFEVGSYWVEDKTIKIQYTDEMFLAQNQKEGVLVLEGKINAEEIKNDTSEIKEIVFTNEVKIYPEYVEPDEPYLNIYKELLSEEGREVKKDENGLYIEYRIQVKSFGQSSDVKVKDLFSKFQSNPSNFVIASSTRGDLGITPNINETEKQFEVNLGTLSDEEVVTISYRMYLLEEAYFQKGTSSINVANSAYAQSAEKPEWIDSTQSTDLSHSWLSKTGSADEVNKVITWTIYYNLGENVDLIDIGGTVFKDIFGYGGTSIDNQNYVEGSFKVYTATGALVSKDSFPQEPVSISGLTFESLTSSAGYTVPEGTYQAYKIEYQSTYESSSTQQKFGNRTTINPFGNGIEDGYTSTLVVKGENEVTKRVIKDHQGNIIWNVAIQVPDSGLENVVFYDLLGPGLKMNSTDVVFYINNGSAIPINHTSYILVESNNPEDGYSFKIELGNLTAGEFEVQYSTSLVPNSTMDKIEESQTVLYHNQGWFTSNDILVNKKAEETSKHVLLKKQQWEKESLDPGVVAWKILIYDFQKTDEIHVEDWLDPRLSLIEESVRCTINQQEELTPSDFRDVITTEVEENGKIVFRLDTEIIQRSTYNASDALVIEYLTKLKQIPTDENEFEVTDLKNKASLMMGNDPNPIVECEATQDTTGKIMTKFMDYSQNTAPFVKYKIVVNPIECKLGNGESLVLIDQLDERLAYRFGSLKITDGNNRVLTSEEYEAHYDEETHQLKLSVPDEMKLVVSYQAKVLQEVNTHIVDLLNVVSLEIPEGNSIETSVSYTGVVHSSLANSSAATVVLQVYKYGQGNLNHPLQNASFKITSYRIENNLGNKILTQPQIISNSSVTDEFGQFVIENLVHDRIYKIEEISAPNAYQLHNPVYVVFKGNLDKNGFYDSDFYDNDTRITLQSMTINENTLLINNEVATTSLNVSKEWEDNLRIHPEVKVTLLRNGVKSEFSLVLNETNHWQGAFLNLPLVDENDELIDYSVEEEAMQNYVPTYNRINQQVTIVNTYKPEVQLIKKDRDHQNILLAGATYQLYKVEVNKMLAENGENITDLGHFTTEGNGKVSLGNLAPGYYYLEEVRAPQGYQLSEEKQYFTVRIEDDNLTIVVLDRKETGRNDSTIDNPPDLSFEYVVVNTSVKD